MMLGYETKEQKIHPSRLITNILNSMNAPLDTFIIRDILLTQLPRFYRKVELVKRKYIYCEQAVKDSNLTRNLVVIHVLKEPSHETVREFWFNTQFVRDNPDSCRMMIFHQLSGLAHFLKYMKIDCITYNKQQKKWIRIYAGEQKGEKLDNRS